MTETDHLDSKLRLAVVSGLVCLFLGVCIGTRVKESEIYSQIEKNKSDVIIERIYTDKNPELTLACSVSRNGDKNYFILDSDNKYVPFKKWASQFPSQLGMEQLYNRIDRLNNYVNNKEKQEK